LGGAAGFCAGDAAGGDAESADAAFVATGRFSTKAAITADGARPCFWQASANADQAAESTLNDLTTFDIRAAYYHWRSAQGITRSVSVLPADIGITAHRA
jgi:hypothetical protein